MLKLTTFTLLKYSVDKNLSTKICRRNVLSTKCTVDEMFCRRNACRQKFVDEMYCRRNVLSTKCLSTKVCRQNVSTKILSTKCFSTNVSLDEKHRIPHDLPNIFHYGHPAYLIQFCHSHIRDENFE